MPRTSSLQPIDIADAFNVPILLTWLRIVLIPLFVGIFYFEKSWVSEPNQNLVATVIFTVAAITDWLDGWLARKLEPDLRLRRIPGPGRRQADGGGGADHAGATGPRGRDHRAHHHRAGNHHLGAARMDGARSATRAASRCPFSGKIKTVSQMVAIPLLLYYDPLGLSNPQLLGTWLIWIAALLTLVSMAYYLKVACLSRGSELPERGPLAYNFVSAQGNEGYCRYYLE